MQINLGKSDFCTFCIMAGQIVFVNQFVPKSFRAALVLLGAQL